MHTALQLVADQVAKGVSADFRQEIQFERFYRRVPMLGIADASQIGLKPSPFSIERRVNTPFSENTYFSAAPLGTFAHLELLQQFETALGA